MSVTAKDALQFTVESKLSITCWYAERFFSDKSAEHYTMSNSQESTSPKDYITQV